MILIIRISGLVEVPTDVQHALYRLRLRRKYCAVLMHEGAENKKLLQKIRNFVAYGPIKADVLAELIDKRGVMIEKKKKKDTGAIVAGLDKKSLEELGIKPFFRLHPPRGGIDSKLHYPLKKGVLGDNKEDINDLVRRML